MQFLVSASLDKVSGIRQCLCIAFGLMLATHHVIGQDRATLDRQLAEAVEKGDAGRVSALLREGASHEAVKDNVTVLGAAAWRGDAAITRLFLAAGADPSRVAPSGETPLVYAARRCHEEIVRILIGAGANARGGAGGSALVWALITGQRIGSRTATALALVEAGSDLNGTYFPNITPLEAAVEAGEFAVARAMIARGADIQANIAAAEQKGQKELVQALRRALEAPPEPSSTERARAISLKSLADLIRRVEAEENRPSDEEVGRAIADATAYVRANPSDADGHVLWARLAKLRPGPPDRPEEIKPGDIISALNRAVKLAPANAEAQYWLGQNYSYQESPTADGMGTRHRSLDRAVEHFRKAVQLAPANVVYRETLALALADQGKTGEAKMILHAAASENALMIGLLSDLEAVPIPPGARFLLGHFMAMPAVLQLAEAGIEDHLRLRVRFYELSTTLDQVDAFYQRRWSGFRFLREAADKLSDTPRNRAEQDQALFQYLRWKDGTLTSVKAESEIPDEPKEGILIGMVEIPNEKARWPTRLLGLTNFRRSGAP